jgi:hypothetical protein
MINAPDTKLIMDAWYSAFAFSDWNFPNTYDELRTLHDPARMSPMAVKLALLLGSKTLLLLLLLITSLEQDYFYCSSSILTIPKASDNDINPTDPPQNAV